MQPKHRLLLTTLALPLFAACATSHHLMSDTAKLSHDVYFTLKDSSPAACKKLVDSCYERLADLPGVVWFAAGTRDQELTRDVNDQGYDVSLHVFFDTRASHDAYQDAAPHVKFIEENRDNWEQVRVFDSTLSR